MLTDLGLDPSVWWVRDAYTALSWDGHAEVFKTLNGDMKVFSRKTCHDGIVVTSKEELEKAREWLAQKHDAGERICDCEG